MDSLSAEGLPPSPQATHPGVIPTEATPSGGISAFALDNQAHGHTLNAVLAQGPRLRPTLEAAAAGPTKPRLLDQLRQALRSRHYSRCLSGEML